MTTVAGNQETITVSRMEVAKEVLRHKAMRQGLYDAGEIVMSGVLVNLHGDDHRNRRRLENRLFRRETLLHYEHDLFPAVIEETLAPHVASGRAELVSLGHQLMMNLAALNSGVDRTARTPEETHLLHGYLMKFIEGATMAHATVDCDELKREVADALSRFDIEFLHPSITRRRRLIEDWRAGGLDESALPRDVLTVLLRNDDNLHLPPDTLLREIAFFLLAATHTSATAFTRATHHILAWTGAHPEDRDLVRRDRSFVQRCVHETIRLSPSSPVTVRRALEDVTLEDGRFVPAGTTVVIDLVAVNRDPSLYGEDADDFNPRRELDEGVAVYGLSFGHGMHACIGQELAAGVLNHDELEEGRRQLGLVSAAVQGLFDCGVRPDPDDRPEMDARTARPYWARYPVVFGPD